MNYYRNIEYREALEAMEQISTAMTSPDMRGNVTKVFDYMEQERQISRMQKPPIEYYTEDFDKAILMVRLLVDDGYEALMYPEDKAFIVKGNYIADWADRFRIPDLED